MTVLRIFLFILHKSCFFPYHHVSYCFAKVGNRFLFYGNVVREVRLINKIVFYILL